MGKERNAKAKKPKESGKEEIAKETGEHQSSRVREEGQVDLSSKKKDRSSPYRLFFKGNQLLPSPSRKLLVPKILSWPSSQGVRC